MQGHTRRGGAQKGAANLTASTSGPSDWRPLCFRAHSQSSLTGFVPTTALPLERQCVAGLYGRSVPSQMMFKFKLFLLPLDQLVGILIVARERV